MKRHFLPYARLITNAYNKPPLCQIYAELENELTIILKPLAFLMGGSCTGRADCVRTPDKNQWDLLLLRARAVENQAYVVAPAQWGQKADGRWTYGRSMIVDPWGTILATCPDRDGFALATLDLDYLDRFRAEFPALENRRPEAYQW